MSHIRVALVGDYNASLTAHSTISPALELAGKASNVDVEPAWIHTSKLTTKEEIRSLHSYAGIWCVPGPPYANAEGAISAISLARTEGIPFLGTCAGFQHALIEYFRNVIGTSNTAHAESNPEVEHPADFQALLLSCGRQWDCSAHFRLAESTTLRDRSRGGRLSLQLWTKS